MFMIFNLKRILLMVFVKKSNINLILIYDTIIIQKEKKINK